MVHWLAVAVVEYVWFSVSVLAGHLLIGRSVVQSMACAVCMPKYHRARYRTPYCTLMHPSVIESACVNGRMLYKAL